MTDPERIVGWTAREVEWHWATYEAEIYAVVIGDLMQRREPRFTRRWFRQPFPVPCLRPDNVVVM